MDYDVYVCSVLCELFMYLVCCMLDMNLVCCVWGIVWMDWVVYGWGWVCGNGYVEYR